MNDELEDFIRRNRASFDDREAPADAWTNIRRALPPSTSWWNSLTMWRAAAVLFMATTLYFVIANNLRHSVSQGEQVENQAVLSEFQDVEVFYTRQISEKVRLIDNFKRSENFNGYTQDFQQLEAMYMVLKEQLKNDPSEQVKDAMVLNLLVRIDLLNQQLHNLERSKKQQTSKDDDRSA